MSGNWIGPDGVTMPPHLHPDVLARTAPRRPTQDSVALRFAEAQAGRLRYCHDAQAWFLWDGAAWRRDRTGAVASLIRAAARGMPVAPFETPSANLGSTRFIAGVERFARGEPALAVTDEAWDVDPFLLGTPAGTVDLRTGLLATADPEHGIRATTAVAPAETADCPLWHRFLNETFDGDPETIGFLRRFLGYALTGSVAEPVVVFGWGTGANGKTVFLDTVLFVMGGHARPAALATLASRDSERHQADSTALAGARFLAVAESEGDAGWSERRIKLLSGGDPVAGRHGACATKAKLLVMGNAPPALAVVDEAARLRFRIVPFRHRPARPDRDLDTKLRAEAPAILRWMIDGCLEWQADGLGLPATVAEATEDYLADQDAVGQFLDACCESADGATATAAELFAAWRAWAEAEGEPIGTRHRLGAALARRGFVRDRTATARTWRGLRPKIMTDDAP